MDGLMDGAEPRVDLVSFLRTLVDIESVSGNETRIADQVERSLTGYDHLAVSRDGNVVVARTELRRAERVVVAGHLDTVPIAANVPSWVTNGEDGVRVWGRGSCDMKGGVAVQLAAAAALDAPSRDVTWIFYDNERSRRAQRPTRWPCRGPHWPPTSPSCSSVQRPDRGCCRGTLRPRAPDLGAAHSARAGWGQRDPRRGSVIQRLPTRASVVRSTG